MKKSPQYVSAGALKKLCSGAQRFCKEQSNHPSVVLSVSLTLERASEMEAAVRPFTFPERANKARNAAYHRQVVCSVPYRNKGCMVDALASRSDEGRDMAAISFGEVPNNL